ncbi:MAG: cell division protein ZapA [Rhodospirillaceae bacterium]|nr:cell division protein ZapA [Rhodospirillaceae bacterium]
MARVDVTVGGRTYPVACDDGQEDRVRGIAQYVDERLADLRAGVGNASETHLLVLTCIVLGDELFESRLAQAAAANGTGPGTGTGIGGGDDPAVAEALAALADEVEALVARVSAP